jgi:glycosyltransferase involved in cell wall biosynthesis
MKIALLRAYPKDAALARMITILTNEHSVDCLIWDRQRDYQPAVLNDNVRYTGCTIKAEYYNLYTFFKLLLFEAWLFLRLLRANVDCIHAIDLDTGFVGFCAAKLRGRAFVYQCLDPYYAALPLSWPRFLGSIARYLENFVISHADLFLITDLLRMPQHEGAEPTKIVMVPNVPHLDLPLSGGSRGDELVVGYIGSLVEGRNLVTIIEAAGGLKGQGVRLVIGGFGPLEERIEECALLHDNVTYSPWLPYEKVLLMEEGFDVIIHMTDPDNPAQKWASPNKLFESMALGKPMIVAEGTLTAQRVAETGNGLIIKYGSKEELQKAILRFRDNPALSGEMGEKGKREFERNWQFAVMAGRLLDAYRDLL